jgi:hypothetical protein
MPSDIPFTAPMAARAGLAPGPEHLKNLDGLRSPMKLPGKTRFTGAHPGGFEAALHRSDGCVNELFGHGSGLSRKQGTH